MIKLQLIHYLDWWDVSKPVHNGKIKVLFFFGNSWMEDLRLHRINLRKRETRTGKRSRALHTSKMFNYFFLIALLLHMFPFFQSQKHPQVNTNKILPLFGRIIFFCTQPHLYLNQKAQSEWGENIWPYSPTLDHGILLDQL